MAEEKKAQKKTLVFGNPDSTARFISFCSFGISFAALVVSFAAFYYTTLAPPDIQVTFIQPEFQLQPHPDPQETLPGVVGTPGKSPFLMIANCTFANNGAQIGNISKVAIQLVSDDGTTWLFVPYRTLDGLPRITEGPIAGYLTGPPFSPLLLPGKQTAHHTFLFLQEDADNEFVLGAHKFHVYLCWYGLSPEPHRQQVSTINFNSSVVAVLKTGALTTLPFDEEREQLRRIMVGK